MRTSSLQAGFAAGLESAAGSVEGYQKSKAQTEREQAQFLRQQNLELLKAKYRTHEAIRAEGVAAETATRRETFLSEEAGKARTAQKEETEAKIAGRMDAAKLKRERERGKEKEEKLPTTTELKYLDSKTEEIEEFLLTDGMNRAEAEARVQELNELKKRFGQKPLEIYDKTPGVEAEGGWLGKDAVSAVLGLRIVGEPEGIMVGVSPPKLGLDLADRAKEMAAALKGAPPEQAEQAIIRAEKRYPGIGDLIRESIGKPAGIMGVIVESEKEKSTYEIEKEKRLKHEIAKKEKVDKEFAEAMHKYRQGLTPSPPSKLVHLIKKYFPAKGE